MASKRYKTAVRASKLIEALRDCCYAADATGTVWLFDEKNPMPAKGFTQLSLEEACRRLAETQQNFEEVY